MKKIDFLLAVTGLFVASCSSDDSNDAGVNTNPSDIFIPAEEGNYWVYDVQSSLMSGRDSLYVSNDTVINNTTYQKLKVKELAYGFFSNALNNNGIRHANGKTYLSGSAGLYFSEDLPFNITVSDFVIFDENATENEQLATISGSFQQEVQGFNLTFNYTLTSKAKATIGSFTSNAIPYTNVKPVEMTLNVSINASYPGFPITYPLMPSQNVVVSTQYYAQGIGAVKTTTDINYTLSQIPGVELPIPSSGSEHQEETLVKYGVD